MSIYFDPSRVAELGIAAQIVVKKMEEALEESSEGRCQLIYNQETKIFTILNSQEISLQTIQDIFSKKRYFGWKPEVNLLADSEGNKTVYLKSKIKTSSIRSDAPMVYFVNKNKISGPSRIKQARNPVVKDIT